MNPQHIDLKDNVKVPKRYVPRTLSSKDNRKQKKNLLKSRRLYKKGIYFTRPKVASFKSKPSKHLANLQKIYGVENTDVNITLAKKCGCDLSTLEKIVKKGEGAYYSSGSRPNQTARSWGLARLASTLTGGNASVIDYHLLESGCNASSKALKLAKKQCKTLKRNCGTKGGTRKVWKKI